MSTIELWEKSLITRDDSNLATGRTYNCERSSYKSVTNYLNKIQDKSFLDAWIKRVGQKKANEIRDTAASHGSTVHSAIEAYLVCNRNFKNAFLYFEGTKEGISWLEEYKNKSINPLFSKREALEDFQKLLKPFESFLNICQPVGIEYPVLWSSECGRIGFGGTSDAFLLIDTSQLSIAGNRKILAVCDWKNFRKSKKPVALNFKKEKYYPLISYCMQLSAYCAAFNQLTQRRYQMREALLVCASPKRVKAEIFYLSPKCVSWHWKMFKQALWELHDGVQFDWHRYCKLSDEMGMLGEQVKVLC